VSQSGGETWGGGRSLPLILTDDPHQVVQQLMLLARANRTYGGFIQQAFHAPKQPRRPFEGNKISVVPAHVCQAEKSIKKARRESRTRMLTFFECFKPIRAKQFAEPSGDLPVLTRPRTRISKLVLCEPFARAPLTLALPHALFHLTLMAQRTRLHVAIVVPAIGIPSSSSSSSPSGPGVIDVTRRPLSHADFRRCPREAESKLDLTLFPPARARRDAPHGRCRRLCLRDVLPGALAVPVTLPFAYVTSAPSSTAFAPAPLAIRTCTTRRALERKRWVHTCATDPVSRVCHAAPATCATRSRSARCGICGGSASGRL